MEEVFKDYDSVLEAGYENEDERMYIATNGEKFYGAAVILYDGLLESFAEKIGHGLYILPTSINEMTIVSDVESNGPAELREVLKNVNHETTEDKDFLSDNIYHYDRETGTISIF